MQKISDTFCPSKWNELNLNLNYNYAYGCCKATPMVYQHNHEEVLNPQKQNLLSGIKDSSCNYCWDVEVAGGVSKRTQQLKKLGKSCKIARARLQHFGVLSLGNQVTFELL